jgi:plasmid stabilization system protein ParE
MSFALAFHPDVAEEVKEAHRWYEQQQAGLGDDFLTELERVYALIQATPQMHQVVYGVVRRALTRRFPYAVYYRVHTDRVEVVAVQHTRRDPSNWQSRV